MHLSVRCHVSAAQSRHSRHSTVFPAQHRWGSAAQVGKRMCIWLVEQLEEQPEGAEKRAALLSEAWKIGA